MIDNKRYAIDSKKQAEYEQCVLETLEKVGFSEQQIKENSQKMQQEPAGQLMQQQMDNLHKKLVICINNNVGPNAELTQQALAEHYQFICNYWPQNKASYAAFGLSYCEHQDWKKLLDGYHLELTNFLIQALKCFDAS